MPRYHRIVVKYRLTESDQWSAPRWCDIEQNPEDNRIQVRTAPVGTVMPSDDDFELLSSEQAKKLLVVDCEEESNNKYCLVLIDQAMYRFNFSHNYFVLNGSYWSFATNDYAKDRPALPLKYAFNSEIAGDARLAMRTKDEYNHQQLSDVFALFDSLKQQYADWQKQLTSPTKQQNPIINWQDITRCEPVNINMEGIDSNLDFLERIPLYDHILNALAAIKRETLDQDEYQKALYAVIDRSNPLPPDENVQRAIQSVRDSWLRNSLDLENIFSQEGSTHPTLHDVYHFVLDCAFLELQVYDSELSGAQSSYYKEDCPRSYLEIQLGRNNQAGEVLLGDEIIADPDDDAALALDLQIHEWLGNDVDAPRGAAHRFFAHQPLPRPPVDELSHLYLMALGAALCAGGLFVACNISIPLGIGLLVAGAVCCGLSVYHHRQIQDPQNAAAVAAPVP